MSLCPDTLALLTSEDTDQIREGCFRAGDEQCLEALPFLVTHLQSRNLGVQEAADEALRRIATPEAVRAMVPLLSSDDAPTRNLSMDILREIGPQDLDTLIALLKSDDPDMRIFASDILGSANTHLAVAPLCDAMLKDPDVNVRYQAAVSLGALAFPEAAPCLAKALHDEEWVQFSVIEAITKIRDDSAVEALARSLDKATDLVASMIIEALGEMGSVKAAVLLLKRMDAAPQALRNKMVKAVVQIMGAKGVAMLSQADKGRIRDAALAAMEDPEEEEADIQDAAVLGLSYVGGDDAARAILRLAHGLDPVSDQERLEHMAQALADIGLTPGLEEVILQGGWKEGMVAVKALERMENHGGAALLMRAFWDKDQEMQRGVMDALQSLADADAAPFLMDVLARHPDATVVKGAILILGGRLRHEPAVEAILPYLHHQYDDVRDAALDACVAIDGPVVLAKFRELFHSHDQVDRMMAVYVFGRLNSSETLPELRDALEDAAPEVRKLALEGLRDVCDRIEDLMPAIIARLADENKDVRLTVVELLGQCCAEVLPHLEQALRDDDDWVKVRALEAMGQRRERAGVPRILPFLQHDNPLLAIKAVEALADIGGEDAFRALLDSLAHDNPDVAYAAEAAVDRLKAAEEEAF